MSDVLRRVEAHLAAFNARDVDACIDGFSTDAVFATGEELFVGRRSIRALFTDSFAAPLDAVLELRQAVVSGETAACELVERITVEGATCELPLAAFYTVRAGELVRVKIYREGSATV